MALLPTNVISPTVANPVTAGKNNIPLADQNPGNGMTRLYDPKAWVGTDGTRLGSYTGPTAHQTYPSAVMGSSSLDGYNQAMIQLAQHFEPMIQMKVMTQPRWWHDRVPRSAFPLFSGSVHETRIFRGGIMKYAGLDEWQDIDPYPTSTNDPCKQLGYETPRYGWEALAWRGKKAAWGSDPICVDQLKFNDNVQQQLAWILSVGAEYGIQMQEVWNRDFFVYQSVAMGRSYVMSSEYNGTKSSPRYAYDPFKYKAATSPLVKVGGQVKPFVIVDATAKIENLNFDVLDRLRESLKVRCPDAAVTRVGGSPTFAIAMSDDDLERYIRGNEEERRLWVEADPNALITGYGFAPTTFRKWVITNDGNQLRFKIVGYIPEFTQAIATANFNGVGADLLTSASDKKPVYVAVAVDPIVASTTRVGVNNSVIPEDNPDYYTAELAIAPIFMNYVFTNQFVPSVSSLGSGTSFGPVTGLNGNWTWLNIQTADNPLRNRGNFYGMFEIVPKPEMHVVHCTSFLYKRCTAALPSFCPAENPHVNRYATKSTKTAALTTIDTSSTVESTGTTKLSTATLLLEGPILVGTGDHITVVGKDKSGASGADATSDITFNAYVIAVESPTKISVQFTGTAPKTSIAKGATVTNPNAPDVTDERA